MNKTPDDTATPDALDRAKRSLDIRWLPTAIFAVAVIASGLWRFFSAEGGQAGLWFGLLMGGLGLVAASLFATGKPRAGTILAWICLSLVGGWFCYESFVKKGFANAETRQLIIISITILTAIFHGWAMRKKGETSL